MKKFIYVFSKPDRDKLLQAGFILVNSDKKERYFVFQNTEEIVISDSAVEFVLSDTLLF